MARPTYYEEEILKTLQSLLTEALPKVWRLIMLVSEEFLREKSPESSQVPTQPLSHERTRRVLATTPGNWAQEIINERKDRL